MLEDKIDRSWKREREKSMCEEWVSVAMGDDSLVVDILLKLNQQISPSPSKPHQSSLSALDLGWRIRQRRSFNCKRVQPAMSATKTTTRMEPDTGARASPTTPLSWSGGLGASSSAADGCEASSRLPTVRSKTTVTRETPASKRSRKKKTLPELKEEEKSLLVERRSLKNKLATLRTMLEKEKATNKKLQKIEHQILSRKASQTDAFSIEYEEKYPGARFHVPPETFSSSPMNISNSCPVQPNVSTKIIQPIGSTFSLPDLNLPINDEKMIDCPR